MQKVKSETEMYWISEAEVQVSHLRERNIEATTFWSELDAEKIVINFAVCTSNKVHVTRVRTGRKVRGDEVECLTQWTLNVARWVRDIFGIGTPIALLVKPEEENGYRESMEEVLELSEEEAKGTSIPYRRPSSPFILDCC